MKNCPKVIYRDSNDKLRIYFSTLKPWSTPAREYVARAFSVGRHEAGTIVDGIWPRFGSFPGESHDIVQTAHDANPRVPVSIGVSVLSSLYLM